MHACRGSLLWLASFAVGQTILFGALPSSPINTWIKRTPSPEASVSPRLGYEGACIWDSKHRVLIRYGGHNHDKDPILRLTTEPTSATTYSDTTAGQSTRRYYVVAVDALGQEGFPSAPVWFEREWKKYYEPFTRQWHQ